MIYPANYPPGAIEPSDHDGHYLACTSHEDDKSWDQYDPNDAKTNPGCTCDQIAEDNRYAAADEKLASMKDEGLL
jgi:hypothetical protein